MAIIPLCSPAQLLGLISIGAVFALRGFHVRLSAIIPELSTIDVMFTISDLLSVRFKLASDHSMRFRPLPVSQHSTRHFPIHHDGCRFIWINGKEVIVKVKVKFYLSPVCNLEKRSPFDGLPLVWCSSVHHVGLSIRRPGFKSRHEHQNLPIDALQS